MSSSIKITYTANENGFEAIGDAIPTPVALPEANLQALAEFEAAFATAAPEPATPQSNGASQQPKSNIPAPSRPNVPAPPLQKSVSASGSAGFSSQTRPGSGSGNFNPQSGYNY